MTRRSNYIHNKSFHFLIHSHFFHFIPQVFQLLYRQHSFQFSLFLHTSAIVQFQYFNLFFPPRIIHQHFKHKTVQLSLRQAISTLMFHRILGRHNNKRKTHRIHHPIIGNLSFFHHLKKSGLGFSRRAVNLVHQQNISKNRTFPKFKFPGSRQKHRSPQNIARHQIRSKLNTPEPGINQTRQYPGHQSFGNTGNSFNQNMPIRQ